MKKIFFFPALIAIIAIIALSSTGTAKIKSYYSGDAINYNGEVLVATTNTGSLEIFKLVDNQLIAVAKFKTNDSKWDTFYDVMFDQENGQLYLYATSGRYLYKYSASKPENMILLKQIKDNSWDWFGALDKVDGHLVTKGNKFIKIWDTDLKVINSYKLTNRTNPYNIRFGHNHKYIYNIDNSQIQIFDRNKRQIVKKMDIKYNDTGNNRLHADAYDNMIYVVDNEGLKKFSLFGGFYKMLKHNSGFGYDVVYSSDGQTVYFSNGAGVQKANKSDLSLVTSFANAEMEIPNSWAMGLQTIQTNNGELIVVFNNSNILILDSELKPIANQMASEKEIPTASLNKIWLKLNTNQTYIGQIITVTGAGFTANENLLIKLGKNQTKTKANASGNFKAKIMVPEVKFSQSIATVNKDVKVTGQQSGLSYSISLSIKKITPVIKTAEELLLEEAEAELEKLLNK